MRSARDAGPDNLSRSIGYMIMVAGALRHRRHFKSGLSRAAGAQIYERIALALVQGFIRGPRRFRRLMFAVSLICSRGADRSRPRLVFLVTAGLVFLAREACGRHIGAFNRDWPSSSSSQI